MFQEKQGIQKFCPGREEGEMMAQIKGWMERGEKWDAGASAFGLSGKTGVLEGGSAKSSTEILPQLLDTGRKSHASSFPPLQGPQRAGRGAQEREMGPHSVPQRSRAHRS